MTTQDQDIKTAQAMVRWLSTKWDAKHTGSTRLNWGKGENYGNHPLEYSIIFQIGNQFFHFFTSDMRFSGTFIIRTCDGPKDFRGGVNYIIQDLDDLKSWLARKVK